MNSGPYLVICWGKGRIYDCHLFLTSKGAEARVAQWEALGATNKAEMRDLPSLLAAHDAASRCEVDVLERWFKDQEPML